MGFKSPLFILGLSSPPAPVVPVEEGTVEPLVVATSWHQTGLSILYSDALARTQRNAYLGGFQEEVTAYTHEVRSIGGFWSASLTLNLPVTQIREWLMSGVGRHIEIYDQGQTLIWEGFVDRVSASVENIQVTRGPLISSEVANKVKVRYSVADYSISPPAVGVTLTSGYSSNTDSQRKYGVIEKVLSLNEVTQTIALQVRDSWLREHAHPQTSIQSTYSQYSETSLTLECLGYWHYLNTWIYQNTSTSTQAVNAKIAAILTSSPNSIISGDTSRIAVNSTSVKQTEIQDRSAATILSELAGMSDSSNNRYTMGFYKDRVLHYQVAPSTVLYYQEVGGVIKNASRQQIFPWEVQPGNFIYYTGLLDDSGLINSVDQLYENPLVGFIESVSFTSPFEVSVTTGRLSKLDNLFARMGITSI